MRRVCTLTVAALLLAWAGVALWNAGKPLPPGLRTTSVTRRMSEADVDYLAAAQVQPRALALIAHAQQLIVVDASPMPRAVAQALLDAQHTHPSLKVVVVTDARGEAEGGTPSHYLTTLESAGVIVARVRANRLRDPNPLYTSAWRLAVGWWDDPYDDPPGVVTWQMQLRERNGKRALRRLLVTDEAGGGYAGVIETTAGGAALGVRGGIARDIVGSELDVARWSSEDDRLPRLPSAIERGLGSVDARWLTESAVRRALLDALATAAPGDEIALHAGRLGDRALLRALTAAAARASVRVLLDPAVAENRAVAAELEAAGGRIDVRWAEPGGAAPDAGSIVYLAHRTDLWLCMGSTPLNRGGVGDFNLSGNVELRLPQRAATARAAMNDFEAAWQRGAAAQRHADTAEASAWRWRLYEATGLGGE